MIPTLLHIPHASTAIPAPYRQAITLNDDALARELLRLTDLYTDELYNLAGSERAVFPVSRFVVDAERFENDALEPMAARGMGVIYTVTTDLAPLRALPTPVEREALLSLYYRPHHEELNLWADRALKEYGRCLLLDCHSFPSKSLPYELEKQSARRPEICIGTDSLHTPADLRECAAAAFEAAGYDVALDTPFSGTLTPGRYYGKTSAMMAMMIEVRKDIYMDEATGEKLPRFAKIKTDVSLALAEIAALAATIAL